MLYLDASALVKRYVAEAGSDLVRGAMTDADGWFMCRIGFVETVRAVSLAGGRKTAGVFQREWPSFGVIDVDQQLAEHATELAHSDALRSLDALHLAAALLLDRDAVTVASWDTRLHAAAQRHGLRVLPERVA